MIHRQWFIVLEIGAGTWKRHRSLTGKWVVVKLFQAEEAAFVNAQIHEKELWQLIHPLCLHSDLLNSLSIHATLLDSSKQLLGLLSGSSDRKVFPCNAGDPGLIPGLERSPGERNGYPLQYSCRGNSMNRGAWWAVVHRVSKGRKWLSD